MKGSRPVVLSTLLALALLGGCRWSNPIVGFAMFDVYNHSGTTEVGDPSSTLCTKGIRVDIYDFYDQKLYHLDTVPPGKHLLLGFGAVPEDDPRYQNPHYRLEALCLTDSGTGKSVREVQGQRLRFEIRPPNFKPGPNPDEVDSPGPWILEKGPLD